MPQGTSQEFFRFFSEKLFLQHHIAAKLYPQQSGTTTGYSADGSEQRHPAFGGVINLNENAIVSGADSILKIPDVKIPPDNSLFLVHHYACTHDFMSFD